MAAFAPGAGRPDSAGRSLFSYQSADGALVVEVNDRAGYRLARVAALPEGWLVDAHNVEGWAHPLVALMLAAEAAGLLAAEVPA